MIESTIAKQIMKKALGSSGKPEGGFCVSSEIVASAFREPDRTVEAMAVSFSGRTVSATVTPLPSSDEQLKAFCKENSLHHFYDRQLEKHYFQRERDERR